MKKKAQTQRPRGWGTENAREILDSYGVTEEKKNSISKKLADAKVEIGKLKTEAHAVGEVLDSTRRQKTEMEGQLLTISRLMPRSMFKKQYFSALMNIIAEVAKGETPDKQAAIDILCEIAKRRINPDKYVR